MKLRWSEGADRDRGEIIGYIWRHNPAAARRMDALFDAASTRLEMFPHIGREGEIPGTRELIPHRSYRLVYEIRDNEIVIVTLVHTSRQWPPAVEDDN